MCRYPWPGNVRELRNNIEAASVLGEGPVLKLGELAPELRGEGVEPGGDEPGALPRTTLKQERYRELLEAFREEGGNRGRMAERLGISRATLYRRLKRHGLI